MTRDEIVSGVIEFLHQHKNGAGGHMQQEPYKQDLFRLFAAAFNAGFLKPGSRHYLSTDALTDVIVERDVGVTDQKEWQDVRTCWQEWAYAWKHRDQIKA